MGAKHRTANFVVDTPDPKFAVQLGEAAERYRHDLAISWLGKPMPNWAQPCPMTVQVGPNLGAGGATSFIFDRGEVFGWKMNIQGSQERLIDSVLPHEITHMIFASQFRQAVPRWADEGGATSVEHASEQNKHRRMLNQFLQTNRGIAFNKMFAMKDYPPDIMPLYAQGFSLADYLIQQGGRRKYVDFVGEGMKTNNWPVAAKNHYGVENLGTLQNTWLAWVKEGSPPLKPRSNHPASDSPIEFAATDAPGPSIYAVAGKRSQPTARGNNPNQPATTAGEAIPVDLSTAQNATAPAAYLEPVTKSIAKSAPAVANNSGWRPAGETATVNGARVETAAPATSQPEPVQVTRPQPFQQPRQVILEWSRPQ